MRRIRQEGNRRSGHVPSVVRMIFMSMGGLLVVFGLLFLRTDRVLWNMISSAASTVATVSRPKESHNPVFVLLVDLNFQDLESRDSFLKDYKPLQEYVEQEELTTLTYQALQSDQDPLHVKLVDRYQNKNDAYLEIHKSSSEFLQFRPKLQSLVDQGKVRISGDSFIEFMDKAGFWTRPTNSEDSLKPKSLRSGDDTTSIQS